jgi:hypothetical protein
MTDILLFGILIVLGYLTYSFMYSEFEFIIEEEYDEDAGEDAEELNAAIDYELRKIDSERN